MSGDILILRHTKDDLAFLQKCYKLFTLYKRMVPFTIQTNDKLKDPIFAMQSGQKLVGPANIAQYMYNIVQTANKPQTRRAPVVGPSNQIVNITGQEQNRAQPSRVQSNMQTEPVREQPIKAGSDASVFNPGTVLPAIALANNASGGIEQLKANTANAPKKLDAGAVNDPNVSDNELYSLMGGNALATRVGGFSTNGF
jgi:hypothetical protein